MAVVFVLLVSGRIPGVFAANSPWQLGWGTTDSSGYTGAGSNQAAGGAIPSAYAFWDEIAFTEHTSSDFLDMATGDNGGGTNIYVATEVLPHAGGSFHMTLCTGLTAGVYNTDKIVWNSTGQWWAFTSTCGSTGYKYSESGTSDSITNGGVKDFVESYDNSTTDWSLSAYTKCEYCMLYWTGTQWTAPVEVVPYWTANSGGYILPPSNLGVDYGCTGTNEPWNIISASYGGLWSSNNKPTEACT